MVASQLAGSNCQGDERTSRAYSRCTESTKTRSSRSERHPTYQTLNEVTQARSPRSGRLPVGTTIDKTIAARLFFSDKSWLAQLQPAIYQSCSGIPHYQIYAIRSTFNPMRNISVSITYAQLIPNQCISHIAAIVCDEPVS